MVVQHACLRIAQVFLGKCAQQIQRTTPHLPSCRLFQESLYLRSVSARSHDIGCNRFCFIARFRGKGTNRVRTGEGSDIRMTDGVFPVETDIVLSALLRRDFRKCRVTCGRNDVKRERKRVAYLMFEPEFYFLVFSERHFLYSERTVFHRQHHHISQSGGKACPSVRTCLLG